MSSQPASLAEVSPSGHMLQRVKSSTNRALRVVATNRLPTLAGAVLIAYALVALFGTHIAPHDPVRQDLANTLSGPSAEHWFGTDQLGRDVFSRTLVATRLSFGIGAAATLLSCFIGVCFGIVAGYYGGLVDTLVSRMADIQTGLPTLLLVLVLLTTFTPGALLVFLSLGLTSWVLFARVIRAQVLSLREAPFIESARACGASQPRIMLVHIVPNVTAITTTLFSLEIGPLIMAEASISFLGAGIQPPDMAWGMMLAEGRQYIATAWWLTTFPGLALFGLVLNLSILANWVRLASDPKRRNR